MYNIFKRGKVLVKESHAINEVTTDINRFKDMFSDNPAKQMADGSWFISVLQLVLSDHAKKVNADYYKRKYVGLDPERVALKLIKTSSIYTGLVGGVVATAISGTVLTSKNNKKAALAVEIGRAHV